MNDKAVRVSGGVGLSSMLGVAFVVLKLTDHIDWSWWWVLSPFWIPPAVIVVGALIFVVGALAIAATVDLFRKRKGR